MFHTRAACSLPVNKSTSSLMKFTSEESGNFIFEFQNHFLPLNVL